MGLTERIRDIEAELNRTQRNKATEHHIGLLKARLARMRTELIEGPKGGKGAAKGEGFEVLKSGDARVAMIGFPSVGKSTLLTKCTKTASAVASYEFTTLTCIPGVIEYNGSNIQLLDLPGIIEGAAQGRGRGRQVIAVGRTADLVLMVLDATKADVQRRLLTTELEEVGIRLNQEPPNVSYKPKPGGGLQINSTVPLTNLDHKTIQLILHEYKVFNAEVLFREDVTVDQFIDVVEGSRSYMRCLYVYNKIDQITIEEVDEISRRPNSVVISCELDLNMDTMVEKIWEHLQLVRVYTKKRGDPPDFNGALIMRQGSTVEDVCEGVHRDMVAQFKYALVWGRSAKHTPQRVGLSHRLEDEDVIQIVKK